MNGDTTDPKLTTENAKIKVLWKNTRCNCTEGEESDSHRLNCAKWNAILDASKES